MQLLLFSHLISMLFPSYHTPPVLGAVGVTPGVVEGHCRNITQLLLCQLREESTLCKSSSGFFTLYFPTPSDLHSGTLLLAKLGLQVLGGVGDTAGGFDTGRRLYLIKSRHVIPRELPEASFTVPGGELELWSPWTVSPGHKVLLRQNQGEVRGILV